MMRILLATTAMIGLMAGCGPSEPGAGAAPAARALTDAERMVRLAALPAPYDEADLENGRRAFARCRSCHTLPAGGPNMTGPNLHAVMGRVAGTLPRYNYSPTLRDAGFAWDQARLDDWLENPRTFLPGNKMSFVGLPDAADRRDLIAFLSVETAPVD